MKQNSYTFLTLCLLAITACKHSTPIVATTPAVSHNYPENIKDIMLNKCATAGCHNAASYTGAGGLLLDSREHLFDGGSNGAVAVPYNTDNSSLLYYVNTNTALGPTSIPTMPYNMPPLTEQEYFTLRDWIAAGAPGGDGSIPFATQPDSRQKIYTTQQGCDLVAVIDAEKQVVMRYIPVGKIYAREQPNNIAMSPDGRYAYVSFWNAALVQKIDTRTDSVIASASTAGSYQKAMHISNDGQTLIVGNWYTQDLQLINTTSMQVTKNLGQQYEFISGFAATNDGHFYAAAQFGNVVYRIKQDGNVQPISIDGKPITTTAAAGTPDPSRIGASPDGSRLFITCTGTNEVRVMDVATHTLVKTIPIGSNPQEIIVSRSKPYMFIACTNDTVSKLEVGSVYAIDYNTLTVAKKITGSFFQPQGLAVDDKKGLLYIFSRNDDKNGPPPHHSGPCTGRNGFYHVYDINTLNPYTPKRFETTVDPYRAAARFK